MNWNLGVSSQFTRCDCRNVGERVSAKMCQGSEASGEGGSPGSLGKRGASCVGRGGECSVLTSKWKWIGRGCWKNGSATSVLSFSQGKTCSPSVL